MRRHAEGEGKEKRARRQEPTSYAGRCARDGAGAKQVVLYDAAQERLARPSSEGATVSGSASG